MFYSKSTGGFYAPEIHGDAIPSDGVEITTEEHAELLIGQSQGKRIVADESGHPSLVNSPAPSASDQAASARARRDALLAASDWVTLRAIETGEDVPGEWVTYRQALRDLPQQAGFPQTINWPTAPESE